MDSLHNYDSGDEPQRSSSHSRGKRDEPVSRTADRTGAASKSTAPPRTDRNRDANYEHIRMEQSEDSNSSSSGHKADDKPARKRTSRSETVSSKHNKHATRSDDRSDSSERRTSTDRKPSKERSRRHRRDDHKDHKHRRDSTERSSHSKRSHRDRDSSSERHRDSKSSRRDRDRDRRHHRHKESRRRSHSKERSSTKHSSRRERSRTRSPTHDRAQPAAVDNATSSSTSSGSHSQQAQQQPPASQQRQSKHTSSAPPHQHLTHRQERDAFKAEQLRKMGIEYGVANAGCNGNSINLAAAYAMQQAMLRNSQPTQLQQYQQLPPNAVHQLPLPLPQPLLPPAQRPAIPSLLSLGVTNPNAPPPSAVEAAVAAAVAAIAKPPASLLGPGGGSSGSSTLTPLIAPMLNLNAAASNAAAPGSISSLTNFTTPSILASARYTEQMQKRKLLWGNKKTPAAASGTNANGSADSTAAGASTAAPVAQPLTNNKWEETRFSQDTDGKVASKFLRLMGMKDATPKPSEVAAGAASSAGGSSSAPDTISKQNELFSTMEHQYEVARQVTHTMRGMGLGFGTHPRQF